jgi:lipoate-protein ligase A
MAFHGSDVSLSVVVPRDMRSMSGTESSKSLRDFRGPRASTVPLEFLMRAVCQSAVRVCHAFGAEATALMEVQTEGRITYCLTEQSPYTVLIGTRKIAGFAVRRYPDGWLIQGSLLVRRLPASLARALPQDLLQRIERNAMPLSVSGGLSEREVAREWAARWSDWWELTWSELTPGVLVSDTSVQL